MENNNICSEGDNLICSGEVDFDRVLDMTRNVNMRLDNEILQDKLNIAFKALHKIENLTIFWINDEERKTELLKKINAISGEALDDCDQMQAEVKGI